MSSDIANIVFVRTEDSEGDKNRGWQVDLIEAYLNGKNVGYLKMSYIPLKRFKRYYKTIFNYMANIEGKCCLPFAMRNMHYEDLSEEHLKVLLTYAIEMYGTPQIHEGSRLELLRMVHEREIILSKGQTGKKFKSFKRYHVNKPLVDYISVDIKKCGIGRALYFEGARWMAEKRMRLYASGLQSVSAKRVWARMEEHGFVGFDKRGKYIKV